jgi:ubiquinone/menaquinone biosynthesis C-methylase UbiE
VRLVLELACGTGRITIPIAHDRIDVVGLDPSPQMLSLAERKTSGSGLTVTWTRGDMRGFDLSISRPTSRIAFSTFAEL